MTQARVNLAVFRIVQPTSRDCKNRQWLQLICRITTVLPFSHDRQRRQVNAVIAVYHQTRKNQYVWLLMRLLSLPQPQSVTMLRRGKSFLAKTPAIAVMGPQPISLRTYQMIPKTGLFRWAYFPRECLMAKQLRGTGWYGAKQEKVLTASLVAFQD